MAACGSPEIEQVVSRYSLGDLVGCQQLDLGYVNESYVIETEARGEPRKYFLRKYKQGITAEEIEFEHSVIDHLLDKGFDLVAGVVRAEDGSTYVARRERHQVGPEQTVFYAIFEFLPGEDRYTWDGPICTREEMGNAARVLAEFHAAVYDASPAGRRSEPDIGELLPSIARNVQRRGSEAGGTVFDAYFVENLPTIKAHISRTRQAIRELGCAKKAQLVIHCDYHPGNLKFRGPEVIGLFDFDWSKIDARCFDVAYAVVYFCTPWDGDRDGRLLLAEAMVFLEAYQQALAGSKGLGPLDAEELSCLPHMISASNIYLLNWTLEDFYGKDVDPVQYLRFLRHSVRLINWLEKPDNWTALKSRVSRLAAS